MYSALYVLLIALPWVVPLVYGPDPSTAVRVLSGLCFASWGLVVLVDRRSEYLPVALRSIGTAWAVAAIVSTLMGLAQYFGVAAKLGGWVNAGQLGEAYANLRQRNHFSTLTNIGLAVVIWRHADWHKQGFAPAATLALAALLSVGNAASGSRTGLLQLVLLGVCVLVWRNRETTYRQTAQLPVLLAAACAYIVATVILPVLIGLDLHAAGMLARLQDVEASCQSRRVLWANVVHLIAQKPMLGWGWGELDYAHFVTLYPGPRFCDILDNAHNLPLHLAVELGVPFALLASALATWLIIRQKPWRERDPTRQLAWAVLALIGLHSLLEYPLWYGPFQMAVALAAWMLWQTSGRQTFQGPLPVTWEPAVRWAAGAATLLMLVACAYAAWDYWRISQIYTAPAQRATAYREDTLQKLQASWLFADYVRFAELTTTPLTPENAAHMHTLALDMLHFSPEPKVASWVIYSARMLGRAADVEFYRQRFNAAFPAERLSCEQADTACPP